MKRSATTRRAEKGEEARYREWIAPMAICAVTGTTDGVELCHIRHFTGAAMKPRPDHTLPLCRRIHTLQETDRNFFPSIGIEAPIAEAMHLYELWEQDDAEGWWNRLHDLTETVDRDAVLRLLMGRAA